MKTYLIIISTLLLITISLFQYGCRPFAENSEPPDLIFQAPDEANNLRVTKPTFGNIYDQGDTLRIKWIAPTIQKINIQLYRKNIFKLTIVQNVDNFGFYDWIIPPNIPISNHYQIKISSQANNKIFNFSEQFGIQ